MRWRTYSPVRATYDAERTQEIGNCEKMQAIYTEQGRMAVAVTTLASVCAVALLGTVLAYWTWVWLAPAPEPRAALPAQAAGAAAPTPGAYAMFGKLQGNPAGAALPGSALKLLGVVAASGGLAAYAVIQADARQSVVVRAGDEVSAGLRLVEVRADRVILSRGTVRKTLVLPEPGKTARPATGVLSR